MGWYNINGIKGKVTDVVAMMEAEEIDILMLQEATGIDDEWHKKLNRMLSRIKCVLICDIPNVQLAIIVRTTRVPTYGLIHSEERLQVIRVVVDNTVVTLANHYGPHEKDSKHYERIKYTISGFVVEGKFLIGGDHNPVAKAEDRTEELTVTLRN